MSHLNDMTSLARLFVGLVVVPTTIWIALAVYYHVRRPWLRWVVSLVPLVVVGASLGVLPLVPWALAVWLGLLVITIAWWFSLRPRSDRDWAVGMEVLPRAEIVGDTLHVRHFRNFSYTAAGEPIPRYEERTYDLAKLSSLDYFLSHWSGPVMAHTLVSFGFDDGAIPVRIGRSAPPALAKVFAAVGPVSLVRVDVCARATSVTSCDCGRISAGSECTCIVCVCLRNICGDCFSTTSGGSRCWPPNPNGTTQSPATARPIFFTKATRECRGG